MKKVVPKVDVNAAVAAKLSRAQKRREERYANERVVYAYASRDGLADNMLLLPRSTEKGHSAYLEMQIASLIQNGVDTKKVEGFWLLRLGVFNKMTYDFKKERPVCVLRIDDVIKKVNEIKKGVCNV